MNPLSSRKPLFSGLFAAIIAFFAVDYFFNTTLGVIAALVVIAMTIAGVFIWKKDIEEKKVELDLATKEKYKLEAAANVSSKTLDISEELVQEDETECPFCKEKIKKGAIKCKHCQSGLE